MEKYKDSQRKFNEDVDKLYKSLNINPKQNRGIRSTLNTGTVFRTVKAKRFANYNTSYIDGMNH